jgi:transcriptional regulator with XRE-family HTH domain
MNTFKQIRNALNLSQSELAEKLECTQGNISNYERTGQTVPPGAAKKLIALCKAAGLQYDFNDLYEDREPDEAAAEPIPDASERSSAGNIYEERQLQTRLALERALSRTTTKPARQKRRDGPSEKRERRG